MKLEKVAQSLNCCQTILGRAFKKSYGLSPVVYRHKLRVMDSIRFMLMEKKLVHSTAYKVGFSDETQFYKHFKKEFSLPPSSYLKGKKTSF